MKERKKVYFASDIHLGSRSFSDPLLIEKRFVRWLDSIKDEAKAIYLLGDIFDFWFEYKHVVPKGFNRFLGKICEISDNGTEIHFFIGNHDIWFFDYFKKEAGIIIHKEPLITQIDGKKFFMAHGDGLGDNSKSFKLIRALFHNRFCQFLFSSIHPRWGIEFAYKWSQKSREKGLAKEVGYLGEEKEHLVRFAKDYLKRNPDINYFIFGHRHIMLDLMLSHTSRLLIAGDWMTFFSYIEWDGQDLFLAQFEEE